MALVWIDPSLNLSNWSEQIALGCWHKQRWPLFFVIIFHSPAAEKFQLMSMGSRMRRTGSEDPHRCKLRFFFLKVCVQTTKRLSTVSRGATKKIRPSYVC